MLCQELKESRTCYPGTKLRLYFAVKPSPEISPAFPGPHSRSTVSESKPDISIRGRSGVLNFVPNFVAFKSQKPVPATSGVGSDRVRRSDVNFSRVSDLFRISELEFRISTPLHRFLPPVFRPPCLPRRKLLLEDGPGLRLNVFARAHGMRTYEPRQGRNAATVVCSASAVVTLAFFLFRL
jgi:hypothetical protein